MIDVDDDDNFNVKTIELTNRMWFSVVFTRNDNGMRYHSGQNDADSRGAAEWVHHNTNVKENFFFLKKALRYTIVSRGDTLLTMVTPWSGQRCVGSAN